MIYRPKQRRKKAFFFRPKRDGKLLQKSFDRRRR
nr:MAG TPA: hypothetical protein [Caudoviricetes sp.]DAX61456.1 MAG TPA: hypothetical protein [Caudoviricetes sp.]